MSLLLIVFFSLLKDPRPLWFFPPHGSINFLWRLQFLLITSFDLWVCVWIWFWVVLTSFWEEIGEFGDVGVLVHLQIWLETRIEALTFVLYLFTFLHLLGVSPFERLLWYSISPPFLPQLVVLEFWGWFWFWFLILFDVVYGYLIVILWLLTLRA